MVHIKDRWVGHHFYVSHIQYLIILGSICGQWESRCKWKFWPHHQLLLFSAKPYYWSQWQWLYRWVSRSSKLLAACTGLGKAEQKRKAPNKLCPCHVPWHNSWLVPFQFEWLGSFMSGYWDPWERWSLGHIEQPCLWGYFLLWSWKLICRAVRSQSISHTLQCKLQYSTQCFDSLSQQIFWGTTGRSAKEWLFCLSSSGLSPEVFRSKCILSGI